MKTVKEREKYMQIEELKINNFGKLKDKNIELKKGINIISGKNESGKSTLLKFITSMLYGVSKNKNGRRISDYEKYTPWEDGEFSGKIIYELDNKEKYEVYRNFTKKNPQIVDNEGNDISKNYTIDKTYGNQFFVEQTKVDEELFNTSMVIMQQEVTLDKNKQNMLIQKASNIMLTGENDVSYKKISAKLNKKQIDEIGTEKSPTKPLYITKQRIEELIRQKQELSEMRPVQYKIENKKLNIEKEIKEVEKELELLQAMQRISNEKNIEQEKIQINIKSKKEIEKKKEEEENNLKNIKSEKIYKKNPKIPYILLILLVILSIALYLIGQEIIAYAGAGLAILNAIVAIFMQTKENNRYKKQKEREINRQNSIKNKIELLENEIKEKEKVIAEKQSELETKINLNKMQLRNNFINIDDIEKILEKNVDSENILNEQKYINDLKLEITKLEMQRREILEKLEKTTEIEEELENKQEKLKELLEYNEAINIAKEALEKAYTKMKENVTPKFSSNLSNAIQNISDGKYKTVKVNEEDGLIIETENGKYVPADLLSIGTIDGLYLTLRISSIKELTRETMPIILDETFAYFDSERLENVLKFLDKEYKDNQILILTCTEREKKALEKLGISYNNIEL